MKGQGLFSLASAQSTPKQTQGLVPLEPIREG